LGAWRIQAAINKTALTGLILVEEIHG